LQCGVCDDSLCGGIALCLLAIRLENVIFCEWDIFPNFYLDKHIAT
jgi:hypothetical protein